MEHVFECSVIVFGVRRRDFVGEERRRIQELHVGLDSSLVEVVGLGLTTCGEEELVRGVHTLVAGVVQVYHRLHVVEEEEKVRKVEQEVEREDKGEETAHMDGHGDDMKDSSSSQGACVCEDEDTTTNLRECARRSVDVVASVRIGKHRCCHWHSCCALSPTRRFSTFLNFHFVLHRRNTSFEVWYLQVE